jgi:DNA-directed RNA polymerase subunit RPC12/RpoP
MYYGLNKKGDKYYCTKCGKEMEFNGSVCDKKTETVTIEYTYYKCSCGHKGVIEREV